GMTPKAMGNILYMIANSTKGMDRDERTVRMSRAMSKYAPMSMSMSRDMLDQMSLNKSALGGEAGSRAWLQNFAAQHGLAGAGDTKQARNALQSGASTLVRRGAGGTITGASLQSQRISGGAKLSSSFVRLEKIGIQTASVIGNFSSQIEKVTKAMQGMLKHLEKFTTGDMMDNLLNLFSSGGTRPKPRGRAH
ncbi:MAG: hypothetical protein KAI47_26225, partial [Deltaproteobacteria bacterium]|nr:hypothetical protein [Deltaproteobacteria bacterium]